MFDFEQAFSKWRKEMAAQGIQRAELLEELENHLREDADQHIQAGLSAEEAFDLAVEGLGSPAVLRCEFERIGLISNQADATRRMLLLERDIMLPIKAMVILMVLYSLYTSHWFGLVPTTHDQVIQFAQRAIWLYGAFSLVQSVLLLAYRRFPLSCLRGVIFISSITDGLFLSLLCVMTGGYESALYWVFLALIVRNSLSLPRTSSALLNLCAISCYTFAVLFDHLLLQNLTPNERSVLEIYAVPGGNEQLLLRVLVMVLVATCCFLLESLFNRQRLRPRSA